MLPNQKRRRRAPALLLRGVEEALIEAEEDAVVDVGEEVSWVDLFCSSRELGKISPI
jgi:hypothetical protein